MKKLCSVVLAICFILCLNACGNEKEVNNSGENSQTVSTQSEPQTSETESSEEVYSSQPEESLPEVTDNKKGDVDNLFTAKIVDAKYADKYKNCYRYDSGNEYNTPVLFKPYQTIYEVKIFSVTDEWPVLDDTKIDKILYETAQVSANKPLLADIKFIDVFAINGISFRDASGKVYYYMLSTSLMDGKLIVKKIGYEESNDQQVEDSTNSDMEYGE